MHMTHTFGIRQRVLTVTIAPLLGLGLAACETSPVTPQPAPDGPATAASPSPSPTPTPTAQTAPTQPQHPYAATIVGFRRDGLILRLRRTHIVGPAGKKWAERHHVDYPFDNDYYDEIYGPRFRVRFTATTRCSGFGVDPEAMDAPYECSQLRQPLPVRITPGEGQDVVAMKSLFRP